MIMAVIMQSRDASVDHTSITPKRATTSLAASVDPTEARCAWLKGIAYIGSPAC
jgi:hypothetical protein